MPDGAATPTTPTPTEIIHVDSRTVACDGGGGALGHPRVYLRIPQDKVLCPYCSRLYILNQGAGHGGGLHPGGGHDGGH
jgi:uncharacterized Zn-finger protein